MLRRALDIALAALRSSPRSSAVVDAVARLEPLEDPDAEELAALYKGLETGRPGVQLYCLRRGAGAIDEATLVRLCKDADPGVRTAAAEALLPKARRALYAEVGWSAETLSLLAACDLETALPALQKALDSHHMQDAAATAILRFASEQPPLLGRLAGSANPLERLRATSILLEAKTAPRGLLTRLLEDEDNRVRLMALEVAAALHHWDPVVAALADPWCRVRACALAPTDLLVSVLTDDDRELVEEALLALSDRGHRPRGDEALAVEHVVDTELRLLSALSDRRALDGLLRQAVDQAVVASQTRLRTALTLCPELSAPHGALTTPPSLPHVPDPSKWTQVARHAEGPLGTTITQLRSIDILEGLPTRVLARLAAVTRQQSVEREVVLQRDSYGSELYLILDGYFQAIAGTEVVRTMQAGEAFGELGALVPAPRSMTVSSIAPGKLLVLDGVHLAAVLRRPDHAWPLIGALVRRIQTQSTTLPPAVPNHDTPDLGATTLVERALALHGCSLFQEARPEVVAHIARTCTLTRLEPQQLLFSRGQPSDALHIVVSGALEISEGMGPIALSGPGRVVGELGALTGEARSADARAMERTVLLTLSREALQRQARATPDLAEGMVAVLVQRLRDRAR